MTRHKLPLAIAAVAVVAGSLGIMSADELRDYQNFPQLSVVATNTQYRRLEKPGTVSSRRIDLPTGIPGPLKEIGSLPLLDHRLEPGYYRIVVTYPSGWFTEHIRHLVEGDEELVRSVFREEALHAPEAWVTVAGGELHVPVDKRGIWPMENVSVPIAGFQIATMEATNRQYRDYLNATGIEPPEWWQDVSWNAEWDSLPVSFITWSELRDFAEWSGARCPTLLEWSMAAHGEKFRSYTWLDQNEARWRGNTQGVSRTIKGVPVGGEVEYLAWVMDQLRPVDQANGDVTLGALGQAPGLLHLVGNVREWTETITFVETPKGKSPDFDVRFTVGGSWESSHFTDSLLSLVPSGIGFQYRQSDVGIRFTKSLVP